MNEKQQLADLYAAYLQKATELERNRKPGQGLFGFGQTPADDPCHEAFIVAVGELLDGSAQAGISQDALTECLAYIFHAPLEHPSPASIHWTLVAAHSACLKAVEALDAEHAQRLYEQYCGDYHRRDRLPVQDRIVKALNRLRRGG